MISPRIDDKYCINSSSVYLQSKPLTSRWVRGFDIARKQLTKSDGDLPGERMGAAVFHGSRLLGLGHNIYSKTRPCSVSKTKDGKIITLSCHAEQMAIDSIKYRDYVNVKLILYIARENYRGELVCSMPCSVCINYAKTHGIKLIRFINKKGIPEEMVIG